MFSDWRLSDAVFLLLPSLAGFGTAVLFTRDVESRCKTEAAPQSSSVQPPPWVFVVAWTLLYMLFGVAWALAWRAAGRQWSYDVVGMAALLTALVGWWVVFANVCMPISAFVTIVCLTLSSAAVVGALIRAPGRLVSAALQVPLVGWLAFASYLTYTSIPGT